MKTKLLLFILVLAIVSIFTSCQKELETIAITKLGSRDTIQVYDGEKIKITSSVDGKIKYSINDGALQEYQQPFELSKSKKPVVIKAKLYKDGKIISKPSTKTFYSVTTFNTLEDIKAEIFTNNWNKDGDYNYIGLNENIESLSGLLASNPKAKVFNGHIEYWDTTNIKDLSYVFVGATNFNQKLNWNTKNVTNMEAMFSQAQFFNQELNFDTSKVTSMANMFYMAINFNKKLNFNTQNVTSMQAMFQYALSFNQDISKWNVEKVKDTSLMFAGGIVSGKTYKTVFNHDISKWNPIVLNNANGMFAYNKAFNQNIKSWQDKLPASVFHKDINKESVLEYKNLPFKFLPIK